MLGMVQASRYRRQATQQAKSKISTYLYSYAKHKAYMSAKHAKQIYQAALTLHQLHSYAQAKLIHAITRVQSSIRACLANTRLLLTLSLEYQAHQHAIAVQNR